MTLGPLLELVETLPLLRCCAAHSEAFDLSLFTWPSGPTGPQLLHGTAGHLEGDQFAKVFPGHASFFVPEIGT